MSRPIVFDGSILGAGPITGVAGSFLSTLRAYARTSRRECILLTPGDAAGTGCANELPCGQTLAGVRTLACLPRGRWRRLHALAKACRRLDAGLLHTPVAAAPIRAPCPVVATVHDLPWLYRELRREPGSRLAQRMAFALALRCATAVVVPSAATRDDVMRCGGVDSERIHVVHHGVELPAKATGETQCTGPFLVLGDDRPRKNHARIRASHAQACKRVDDLPALRFVGPGHGYVAEPDKWTILRRSRALLQPSLLEGFGLPVLEAFAHGVPVVCSNSTALAEVAGDAALQVDPRDETDLAAAIVEIHCNDELRRRLRRRGLERARRRTPDRAAAAWRELHEELWT